MWWWGRKKINSSLYHETSEFFRTTLHSLISFYLKHCWIDVIVICFLYPLSISWCSNWYKHFLIRKLSGNNTRNSTINCDVQLTSFHQPPVSQLPCILKALLIHIVYFLDWEKKLLSHIRFIYIYEAALLGVDEPTDVIPFLLSHIACEPCFHEALVIMWVSFCRVGIFALLCFFFK